MTTTIIPISDNGVVASSSSGETTSEPVTVKPKKRRKTAYQAKYGRNFRALKKKHPRWSFKTLTTKAHKMTRSQK